MPGDLIVVFEYRIVTLDNPEDREARQALFDQMGAQGWRLVTSDCSGDYVFMRERAQPGPSETK